MFEPTSRYSALETATLTKPDGQKIAYQRRRFLPQGRDMPLLVEVSVAQGDLLRLDLIATRTLGDPEQFWRICDANDAMNPFDLTTEIRRILRVPVLEV